MTNKIELLRAFSLVRKHYQGPVDRGDGSYVPLAIQLRPIQGNAKATAIVVKQLTAAVRKLAPDAVAGGLTGGAIWGALVAYELGKPFILVRKQARGRSVGKGEFVQGDFRKGQKVVLVDDAFLSGATMKDFVSKLRRMGLYVPAAVVVEQTCRKLGRAWSKRNRIKLYSLVDLDEIVRHFEARGHIDGWLAKLSLAFCKDPYGWHKNKRLWKVYESKKRESGTWRVR